MKKEQFLRELGDRLANLPYADKKLSLDYYSEMIDDRIEDGLSEEEAIRRIGTPAAAATEILTTLPIITLARARFRHQKNALVITLIILGSLIWISLLAAAFTIVITMFAVLFSLFIALWATEVCFAAGVIAGLVGCPLAIIFEGQVLLSVLLLGAAFVLAALTVFGYYGAIRGTKGLLFLAKCVLKLCKLILKLIKFSLIRKETIR